MKGILILFIIHWEITENVMMIMVGKTMIVMVIVIAALTHTTRNVVILAAYGFLMMTIQMECA